MVCRARLSWRSPPRLSRCRCVGPLEAGTGADAGEGGEAGFGAEPAGVRPGDDQLGGDDRADAGLVEQCRGECAYVAEDPALELAGFAGRGLDAAGEATQDEPGGELVGSGGGATEAAAALDQLAGRQSA